MSKRTPQRKAEQKARSDKNKLKPPKKRQFRTLEVRLAKKALNKKLRKNK